MSFTSVNHPQAEGPSMLFQGARFWLSQSIPQRLKFKDLIKQHGGTVVLMEKDADVKLVDHTKKNLSSDVFSYQYVERSIQNGRLEDLEAHRAGPSAPRPMGASNIPKKGKRSYFTLKEDQVVFDWVYHFTQERGAPVQGNKIYQDLGELFPAHPWQSWRSRYLKHLNGKARPGGGKPQSFDELMDSAPARAQGPKLLPKRTPEKESAKANSTLTRPQPRAPASPPPHSIQRRPDLPAPVQTNIMTSSKRKRDVVPPPPNESRTEASSSKRRAVEVSTSTGSPSIRPSHQSRGPQWTSPTLTTPPAPTPDPRDSTGTHSSISNPIEDLGLVNLPTQALPTHPPQTSPGPPRPQTPTKESAPIVRPLGDNAFAMSGRFKKQEPKPKSTVSNPFRGPIDPVFLELPFLPSSPASEATDEDAEETPDVDSWIDQRLARGFDENHVFDALRCTSMVPEMADKVLELLAAGEGIPDNIPGVWTTEDDRCLQAEEQKEVQRALSKHGAEAFGERWEYFRMARQTGLID